MVKLSFNLVLIPNSVPLPLYCIVLHIENRPANRSGENRHLHSYAVRDDEHKDCNLHRCLELRKSG